MVNEAERLRRCREVFALGVAEQLPMDEARRELTRRRWAEADARLAARRCGTRADVAPHGAPPAGAGWMHQGFER